MNLKHSWGQWRVIWETVCDCVWGTLSVDFLQIDFFVWNAWLNYAAGTLNHHYFIDTSQLNPKEMSETVMKTMT